MRWLDSPTWHLEPDQRLQGTLHFAVAERDEPIQLLLDQGYVEDGREAIGAQIRYRCPDLLTDLLGLCLGVQAELSQGTEYRPIPVRALPMDRGWLALEIPAGPEATLALKFGNEVFPQSGPFGPHFSVDIELHAFLVEAESRRRISDGRLLLVPRSAHTDWLRVLGPADAAAHEPLALTVCFQSGASSPRTSSDVALDPAIQELEVLEDGEWRPAVTDRLPDSIGARGLRLRLPLGLDAGIQRVGVRVVGHPEVHGLGDPIAVHESAPDSRRWFGALHNHTAFGGHAASTPRRMFDYARNVSRLDFCALTEHSEAPGFDWPALVAVVEDLDREGSFVTFAGFEWTHPTAGHRHVLFEDAARGRPVRIRRDSADEGPEVAADLDALAATAGQDPNALLVVHHPMLFAASVQTHFDYGRPDQLPRQRLAEVYSWHGSSLGLEDEAFPLHDFVGQRSPTREPGILNALGAGHRLSLVADGDNHLGLPGSLVGIEWTKGRRYCYQGLTVVRAASCTRAELFRALEEGRTYGTTGARNLLEVRIVDSTHLRVRVHGSAPLARLRLLGPPDRTLHCTEFPEVEPTESLQGVGRYLDPSQGTWDHEELVPLSPATPWVLEIQQQDSHTAWCSSG